MALTEFHETLGTLGIAQQRLAHLFNVSPRAVRRWEYGERRVPRGVVILVRLLADGAVTIAQVEQAAVARTNGGTKLPASFIVEAAPEESASAPVEAAAPACANGGAEPEPPAPLHLEPTSESSTDLAESAPEPSAILAGSATTAEKVAALTATSCRWPCGDPLHSDFRFCGSPVTAPPYCEEHRGVAYLAPPAHRLRPRG
jgi:hypothetical protein